MGLSDANGAWIIDTSQEHLYRPDTSRLDSGNNLAGINRLITERLFWRIMVIGDEIRHVELRLI